MENLCFQEFVDRFQKAPVVEVPNSVADAPLVSVLVTTYQHKEFIAQTLEKIIEQKTDFPFEILIGEDGSTDGTRDICIDFAKRYPNLIRLFLHDRRNVISYNGRATGRFNSSWLFYNARGKYRAYCEGDDCWTNDRKIQTQAQYLEDHPDVSVVFHNADVYYKKDDEWVFGHTYDEFPWNKIDLSRSQFGIADIIRSPICPTASLMVRAPAVLTKPLWTFLTPMGDLPLLLLSSKLGHFKFLPGRWCVYRKHVRGVTAWHRGNLIQLGYVIFYLGAASETGDRHLKLLVDAILERLKLLNPAEGVDVVPESWNYMLQLASEKCKELHRDPNARTFIRLLQRLKKLGVSKSDGLESPDRTFRRVLFVAHGPNQVNGPNVWLKRLLPRIKESGWEPVVLMFMTSGGKCKIADHFEETGVVVVREKWSYTEDQIAAIFVHVQRLQPVAFVPNLNVAAYYASKWILRAGIPTIGMLHSDDRFHEELLSRFACGEDSRHLSVLGVVSEGQLRRLESDSRLKTELRLLSYGAPVPHLRAVYASAPFRFVYAGRLEVRQKQVLEMLDGMISVLNKHPSAEFYICGDGTARPALQAKIVQAKMEDRIRLLGNLESEDLETVYLNCQSFILLSDYEGLPIALQEAMGAGLVPICLRECNGCAELIEDGYSGFLIDDRNKSLLEVASSLIGSEDLWNRLSAQARLKIVKGYSSDLNAEAWNVLLNTLVSSPSKASIGLLDLPKDFELPLPLPSPDGLSREDRRRPVAQNGSNPGTSFDHAFLNPAFDVNNADLYLVRSSILNAIKKHSDSFKGVFLDIGCGVMPYRSLIEAKVDRYLGLDIETDIYRAEVELRWDGRRIPLADNSVDSAMATEVLEHCPEPLAVLQEARRVLKPGGVFFFTVPYVWPLHDAPYDFYRYTPFSLERLLTEAGFESIKIDALGGWNASLAQMIGLWLKRSPMDSQRRVEMASKLWPLYSELVRTDTVPDDPRAGNTMATGWCGVARVAGLEDKKPVKRDLLDLPLCIVRAVDFAYSETFIEDHIHGLSNDTTVIHGFPTPAFDKDKRLIFNQSIAASLGEIKDPQAWMSVYTEALVDYFQTKGFKVVLAETSVMAVRVFRACRKAGIPMIVHFHGSDAFQHNILQSIRSELPEMFSSAASIVVVSEAMKAQVLNLGAPAEKIVLGPYGVNIDVLEKAQPAGCEPSFLAVGRFVPKKAPDKTIRAFAKVVHDCPSARLVMVGDGPLLDHCKQLSKRLGLADEIEFTGVCSREKVSSLMASVRCFVQHSVIPESGDSEGLPLSILESGAHGLPVVSTRHAGIPDAVREGQDGFLVDEGDIDGMASAMLEIAMNPKRAQQMGESYRQRVEQYFSRELSLNRLRQLIKNSVCVVKAVPRGDLKARQLWQSLPESTAERSQCLSEILSYDRNFRPSYLQLGKLLADSGEFAEAYLMLSEALRVGPAEPALESSLKQLESNLPEDDGLIANYRFLSGRVPVFRAEKPKRILVVTNLFPPQHLGGYGRTMWEFCDLLKRRGHEVLILTADRPDLLRKSDTNEHTLEPFVERSLQLAGGWDNGSAVMLSEQAVVQRIYLRNARTIRAKARSFQADVCLQGNIDFLGWQGHEALIKEGIPVVHRLGNEYPGYPVSSTPRSPLYCMAGNTEWMNRRLKELGFECPRFEVVYPGSPLEYYFRALAPDRSYLRIAYASIVQKFKGIHVLVDALIHLKSLSVPFRCEIAGEQVEPELVEQLKAQLQKHDLLESVEFVGFQNKQGLAALFARSNVLVFPSAFEEPFGKTQIEAMAAGLLVVSSGTGGSGEIVRDGENGLIFESQNPIDLAKKLQSLCNDPVRWAEMAANGQASAYEFTTQNSVEKLEQIFDSLCENHKIKAVT